MSNSLLAFRAFGRLGRDLISKHTVEPDIGIGKVSAVEIVNPAASGSVVLVCEHASHEIPVEYGHLGLAGADLMGHIAWDIGAAALTRQLSDLLEAPAFLGTCSRLVVDLNRPFNATSAIPERSGVTEIPGNKALDIKSREQRWARHFSPFHATIADHLAERQRAGCATLLLTIHSFTPVLFDELRPWHAGVLFGRSEALAIRVASRLARDPSLTIGLNKPYKVTPEDDYTIPVHGDANDIPALLIEVRNDQLVDQAGIDAWARRLGDTVRPELSEAR